MRGSDARVPPIKESMSDLLLLLDVASARFAGSLSLALVPALGWDLVTRLAAEPTNVSHAGQPY